MKTLLEGKTNRPLKTSRGEQKLFIDLNDRLKYNININVTTRGIGTMLTHPLGLRQFGQWVSEQLA